MPATPVEPDLHHHGDREIGDGLVDLAVNVRVAEPPEWLAARLRSTVGELAAYPRTENAVAAIAAAHGVSTGQVLPTAGGAEAFTLLARSRNPRRAVIVHPQFTEPEAALLAAGHRPERLILTPDSGFTLDPAAVPDGADLVVIGNPTNPTSVLHPAERLRQLIRPGRLVVVDEAFSDAVPGEPETMIGGPMTGLLVLRSLTKTWGLAGLRAGYAVGDAGVIAGLAAQQPPWSVSTPSLIAIEACLSPAAREQAAVIATEVVEHRRHLVGQLTAVGLPVVTDPHGPFVLVDSSALDPARPPGWFRLALREHGFAVRRGDTFPGLTADWIRIAVRAPSVTDDLVGAIRHLC